ncbi:MAG TPA: class I SAM-dependent methyltransferase [Candidatus Paceibacterota bacterium]
MNIKNLVDSNSKNQIEKRTIDDFGEQWTNYRDNPGHYGSSKLLLNIFGPLLAQKDVEGSTVAEIGSGTGRIVNMLLDVGVSHVYAVEPSEACEILKDNTESRQKQITYMRIPGDALPANLQLDFAFSIGVIHHIPNPMPTLKAMYNALRPGGKILIWIYGREGNETYLSIIEPIRNITKKLPHSILMIICSVLLVFLELYIFLCRFLPLPMHDYMKNVLGNFPHSVRHMTIYDQLNPSYAKYYTKEESLLLLTEAHFHNIGIFHRHGYSWTLIGTKTG